MTDLYGSLLSRALFPAFEAVRGRPTVPLRRYLEATSRWSPAQLLELQGGLVRRLLRHAYRHTAYYRRILDEHGLRPDAVTGVADLERLPLLDRSTVRETMRARTALGPPEIAVRKATSGSSGQPVSVLYSAESRHWRDATRWRGYGWGGYQLGMRALHYWGVVPGGGIPWWQRGKVALDRRFKRDLYVDSTPRAEPALRRVVEAMRRFRPQAVVAYASGAGALARFVNDRGLRDWDDLPVITGAEALLPHDREAIRRAFGDVFESYGCREVMLMASECEAHAGLHTTMENLVVEIVVRDGGSVRAARPGETGEVVITDLHNLACPMIRYVNGDLAVASSDAPCPCGRGLVRIGGIQGRVTDTLYDGRGNAVGGLVFNILIATLGDLVGGFQVRQRPDGSVVFLVVPDVGGVVPRTVEERIRAHAARYLPGVAFAIEVVEAIPLTPAGKRQVVVCERRPPGGRTGG